MFVQWFMWTRQQNVDFNDFGRWAIGMGMWAIGAAINIQSDYRLRMLRVNKGPGIHIPHGGFFESVSAANYFGEILEWLGYAIACHQLPAYAFAFFTFCNLAPRAHQHHTFYRQYFGSRYPAHRKALLPGVW